jgi:hypothetical protein
MECGFRVPAVPYSVRRIIMGAVNAARTAAGRFGTVGELLSFFWSKKRWWLVPMLVTLFLLGVLIVLAQSSAIAPFIYTLF